MYNWISAQRTMKIDDKVKKVLVTICAVNLILFLYCYTPWAIHNHPQIARPVPLSRDFNFLTSLTFQCGFGELGNRMFFYAVVYGLSKLNNRTGYVQKCNTNTCRWSDKNCTLTPLHKTFDLTLPVGPNLPQEKQVGHPIRFHITYPSDYRISPKANILVGEAYPNSVTFILHVREEIRREFRFRQEFVDHAKQVLKIAQGSREDVTLVGVHVRRGSYLIHLKAFKKMVAPPQFFKFAMNYFRSKFDNALFVVSSDDLPWCRENIRAEDVYILEKMSTPANDLAVLSHCNHSIFDYGTYGLWAAFLAGGEAMYFIDGITDPMYSDPVLAQVMYPSEWIGVSNKMLKFMI